MCWSGKGIGDWLRTGGGEKAVIEEEEGWVGHGWFGIDGKERVFFLGE